MHENFFLNMNMMFKKNYATVLIYTNVRYINKQLIKMFGL